MTLPKTKNKLYFFNFVNGCILSLAFQPVAFWLVIVPSFFLFYKLFCNYPFKNCKEVFLFGLSYGFGHFLCGLYWIPLSFHINWPYLAWFFPVALLIISGVLGSFFGIVILITYLTSNRKKKPLSQLIIFTLSWSILEWVRGNLFPKFPWLNIAEISLVNIYIAQILSVMGNYGTGLIILIICMLIYIILQFPKNYKIFASILLSLLIIPFYIYGTKRLSNQNQFYENFNIVMVQPNINQIDKLNPNKAYQNLKILLQATDFKNLSKNKKNVIIWPEASIPFIIHNQSPIPKYLSKYLNKDDILIFGATRKSFDNIYNSLYIINSEGRIIDYYDKNILVPFGEYFPYRKILPKTLANISLIGIDYTAGKPKTPIHIDGIPNFTPLICYEVLFSKNTAYNDKSGKWILNITNDGWFLHSSGPYQHLHIARMRAIEQGKPMVRCVYKGISSLIDPYGRILTKIPFASRDFITRQLPKPIEKGTAYSKYGDLLYWIIIMTLIIFMLFWRSNYEKGD